jgi:hypothetical protein
MRTSTFAFAVAGLLASACVHAQRLDQPTPPMSERTANQFSSSLKPFTYLYNGANDNTAIYDSAFGSYRTDPKLVAGLQLSPHFAVETGYANLFSRGFHFVDYGRGDEWAGALGTRGFSSYVAGKLAIPIGGHLSAYGKLGVAYSQHEAHDRAGWRVSEADLGAYANVGARYKLNDRAVISGELTRAGDTANKWGGAANATGASASLKVGF